MQKERQTSNPALPEVRAQDHGVLEKSAASPALAVSNATIQMSNSDPVDELRNLYPPILTTAQVAEMMHCTDGDVRDKAHRGELNALRWGQQFRFFRDKAITALKPYEIGDPLPENEADTEDGIVHEQIDYDTWYPEVPAVMDSKQLADLLNTSDQMVRAWTREGVIPAHRRPTRWPIGLFHLVLFRLERQYLGDVFLLHWPDVLFVAS